MRVNKYKETRNTYLTRRESKDSKKMNRRTIKSRRGSRRGKFFYDSSLNESRLLSSLYVSHGTEATLLLFSGKIYLSILTTYPIPV